MKGRLLGKKGCHASTFTVDGITDTLVGWAARLGTNYHCLYKRIVLRGVDPVKAIRMGNVHQNRNFITANGETHYINEWARITGVSKKVIHARIRRGWSLEEAIGIVEHDDKSVSPITWRGKTLPQSEWADRIGLDRGLFYARVRQWRNGDIPKKDVFRKEKGHTGRKHVLQMHYYKGKRYTIKELCAKKGCGTNWFHTQLAAGHSIYEIMEHIEPCRDPYEIAARSRDGYHRYLRKRELRKMGVLV